MSKDEWVFNFLNKLFWKWRSNTNGNRVIIQVFNQKVIPNWFSIDQQGKTEINFIFRVYFYRLISNDQLWLIHTKTHPSVCDIIAF